MNNKKYSYVKISHEHYQKVLDILEKRCSFFDLVEPNMLYAEEPYQLPEIKEKLKAFCTGQARVRAWNGTQICGGVKQKWPMKHTYKCNKASITHLRIYSFFFELEDDIDIAFYSPDNKEAVFYTVSHEGICMIDKTFWGDCFEKMLVT